MIWNDRAIDHSESTLQQLLDLAIAALRKYLEGSDAKQVESIRKTHEEDDELLTVDDLCAWFKVKPAWVYDQVEAGELPHLKLGRRHMRFRRGAILEYLKEGERRTKPKAPRTQFSSESWAGLEPLDDTVPVLTTPAPVSLPPTKPRSAPAKKAKKAIKARQKANGIAVTIEGRGLDFLTGILFDDHREVGYTVRADGIVDATAPIDSDLVNVRARIHGFWIPVTCQVRAE